MKAATRSVASVVVAPVVLAVSALGAATLDGCLSDASPLDPVLGSDASSPPTTTPDATTPSGDDDAAPIPTGDDDSTPDATSTGDDASGDTGDAGADAAPGNGAAVVAILRVGDGVTALGSTSTTAATFVDLYSADGTLVTSVPLSAASDAGVLSLTSSLTEGYLSLATDRSAIFVAAHDVPPGANLTTDAGGIALGRIDVDASLSLQTGVTGTVPSNVRSVATIDGGVAWISDHEAVYALNASRVATKVNDLNGAIPREVAIFDSQLYVSSASTGAIGVSSIGTGTPTAAATDTILPGPVNSSTYQYVMFDTDANGSLDLLYTASTDGVEKWTFSTTTLKWSKVATTALAEADGGGNTMGACGLTGRLDGTAVTLYTTTEATAGNAAFRLVDTVAGDAGAAVTPFASATAKTGFRGVAFTPGN